MMNKFGYIKTKICIHQKYHWRMKSHRKGENIFSICRYMTAIKDLNSIFEEKSKDREPGEPDETGFSV